jgi:hypothetical protein
MPVIGRRVRLGAGHKRLVSATSATGGALGLEAIAAIDGAIARGLEGDFGSLAAGGAGSREHLTGPAEAAATAAPAVATTAAAAAAAAVTAAAASAIAGGLGSLTGIATGLAAFGFIRETAIRKPLLLIGSESKLSAAIDAYNGFVLKRHNVLQGN